MLAASGCALDDRVCLDSWMGPDQFSRLIEAAVEQTADPAFGLHWGERSPLALTHFGIVSSLAHWAPSPRTALSALTRFQGLMFRGGPVAKFQVHGHLATLSVESGWLQHGARRAWSEFVAVASWSLLKTLCGRSPSARVTFEHAAPRELHEYGRILGGAVGFGHGSCSLQLDSAQLETAQPQFNPRLNEAVLFEASCALDRLSSEQRCSARVREQLASGWLTVPTMESVARKLGMSSRTLRRHLEHEGAAFPDLVVEALRTRALRLLGDPKASVKEVAYALGFATPSAFHRAFKRWTGSSPSEVRASRVEHERAPRALTY
jgi:AraC-like DNA-binding protein